MQRYNGQLLNQFPNTVTGISAAGAQITVKVKSTGALATLYATNSTSGATLSNPLTADSKGYYGFYAPDGVYTLGFNISGTPQLEIQLTDTNEIRQDFDEISAEFAALTVSNAAFIVEQQENYDNFVISGGWDNVGTFSAGFTFASPNQVGADGSGNWWRWAGSLPKTVSAGTNPASDANYKLVGDGVLRADLAADNSTVLVGGLEAGYLSGKFASIVDFGAVGDGATDNTAAITAALAAADDVYVPAGTFVSAKIVLAQGKRLHGGGEKSVLKFKTGETGVFISITAGASLSNLRVSGGSLSTQAATTTEGSRIGIQSACLNSNLFNLTVDSFDKYGIYLLDTTYVRTTHVDTLSLKIKNCFIGLKSSAEYLLHSNIDVVGCRYGIHLNAGNNSFTNCKIHENYYGFYLTYGAGNEGHGNLNNSMINHNTVGIHCSSIGIGFNFIGNQFFEGKIEIIDCQGIHISNCELDATEYYFSGSGRNVISNNVMIQGYENTIIHNSDNTVFMNNYTKTGAVFVGDTTNVADKKVHTNPYLYQQYETMYIDKSPDNNFYLLANQSASGTGAFYMQAGAGSASFGAGLIMHGASHATKPGDFVAGINGSFRVNGNGIGTGADLFTVDIAGNAKAAGKIEATSGVKVGYTSSAASAANEGTMRYSSTASSSVLECSMRTGASTYAWVVIESRTW